MCGRNLDSLSSAWALVCLGHPVQVGDRAPVRLDQVGDQGVHPLLGHRREVPFDVDPTDGLAQRALDQGHPALPPLAQLRRPRQHRPVEPEVLVDERPGQERGQGVDHPPAGPGPPGGQPLGGEQTRHLAEEGRLHGDELAHRRLVDVRAGHEGPPVQAGRGRGEVVQAGEVVHQPQVADLDLVPVGGRDVGLQGEDQLGLLGGVGQPGELEGAHQVVPVLARIAACSSSR